MPSTSDDQKGWSIAERSRTGNQNHSSTILKYPGPRTAPGRRSHRLYSELLSSAVCYEAYEGIVARRTMTSRTSMGKRHSILPAPAVSTKCSQPPHHPAGLVLEYQNGMQAMSPQEVQVQWATARVLILCQQVLWRVRILRLEERWRDTKSKREGPVAGGLPRSLISWWEDHAWRSFN